MISLNITVLVFIAAGAWWLTGIDKTAGGESKRSRHFTRALRCIAVVFLSAAFAGVIEQPNLDFGDIPYLIILPVSIAIVLRSSLSELCTHGFFHLMDPSLHDDRPFDPGQSRRCQDAIAQLIRDGQRDEAIKLCEQLKLTGEVDLVTLENTLEFLGVPQTAAKYETPLKQAARLRSDGKFAEAESSLKSLLAKNPADTAAAMMLMRLYAEDLRQPSRAYAVVQALAKQPHVPAGHLEYARRSIEEWSRHRPAKAEPPAAPKVESVDDLLAQGFVGSAVERLEEQAKQQPRDFELQLKLAEVFAINCRNVPRAEKIIRQIESQFSPEQFAVARAKLAAWQVAANQLAR